MEACADEACIETIPWCAELLAGPNVIRVPTESREPKESTEDALFAQTLKTQDTISGCLTFHDRPDCDSAPINQVNTLVSLGYAVNGYPHVAHGGVVATLIDEVMGLLLSFNKQRGTISDGTIVTANLNITYLMPVATPQTVLVSSMFKEIVGRKLFVHATIKNSLGKTLTKADALWIAVDKAKEKL